MNTETFPQFKYDFSGLSKGRLRAYNRAVQELESMQDVRELDDDALDMLAAAGEFWNGQGDNLDERR